MRVGLLWRGDPNAPLPKPADTNFRAIFAAFAARDVAAEPVIYDDGAAERIRAQLLEIDAVLVWVDPIVRGQDRTVLDALLRDVARAGVIVSAHPDVIDAMGTKQVLHRSRHLPFGTDTHLYASIDALSEEWPAVLRSSGPRVLKQDRGSGGNGVWRVEIVRDAAAYGDLVVRVQPAQRGASVAEMRFADFIAERATYLRYFEAKGAFVDQPYCDRLAEGMTRCYVVVDRVAGFGHQYVTALLPPSAGSVVAADPPPRLYYGPDEPRFQRLRALMDSSWIGLLQEQTGVDRTGLPLVWDADFLLGPPKADGDDHVLCEINVSGVYPMPDEAVAPLAQATIDRVGTRMISRSR